MAINPYKIQLKKSLSLAVITLLANYLLIFLSFGLFYLLFLRGLQTENIFESPIIFVLVIAVLLCISILWEFISFFFIEYSIDNKNFVFKGGIISRVEKIIPLSKIQHVIIYESLWQRLLGLSSVSIETARESAISNNYGQQTTIQSQTGPLIPNLDASDAEKLKNQIISLSNKKYKPIAGI